MRFVSDRPIALLSQVAKASKETLEAELELSQVKVAQAQGVLQAMKREVKRWQLEGSIMDIKHRQVGWDVGAVNCLAVMYRKVVLSRGSKVQEEW